MTEETIKQEPVMVPAKTIENLMKLARMINYLVDDTGCLPNRCTFAEGYYLGLRFAIQVVRGKADVDIMEALPDIAKDNLDPLSELVSRGRGELS